jgi:hypothetical protein
MMMRWGERGVVTPRSDWEPRRKRQASRQTRGRQQEARIGWEGTMVEVGRSSRDRRTRRRGGARIGRQGSKVEGMSWSAHIRRAGVVMDVMRLVQTPAACFWSLSTTI